MMGEAPALGSMGVVARPHVKLQQAPLATISAVRADSRAAISALQEAPPATISALRAASWDDLVGASRSASPAASPPVARQEQPISSDSTSRWQIAADIPRAMSARPSILRFGRK